MTPIHLHKNSLHVQSIFFSLVAGVHVWQAPELVQLHELPGEGHLSAFCYNDKIHQDTLSALFGSAQDTHSEASLADVTKALENAPPPQATEEDVARADPLRRELGALVSGSSSEQKDSVDNAIEGAQG